MVPRRLLQFIPVALVLAMVGCSKKSDPRPAPSATTSPPASTAVAVGSSPAASRDGAPSTGADASAATLYYTRKITAADLEGRSLRDLSLIRNMPFARAGKRFRKPWLTEYFSQQPWYQPKDNVDESKITELDRENANFTADYEAKLDRAELQRRADALGARGGRADLGEGGPSPSTDALELQLLSIRLGRPQSPTPVAEGPADAAPTTSPLEDPKSLDRLLTVRELDSLSQRDLRILRNTIYARRGRPFKSPILDSYFSSTDWYKPDTAYTDARLTAIDQKNIKIVRSVEDSLGGPLTDAAEAGWFGGA